MQALPGLPLFDLWKVGDLVDVLGVVDVGITVALDGKSLARCGDCDLGHKGHFVKNLCVQMLKKPGTIWPLRHLVDTTA